MLCVLLAKEGLLYRYLPVDAEGVILDTDASVCLWGIEIVTLILEDGCFAEDGKTVGKASWYKGLP